MGFKSDKQRKGFYGNLNRGGSNRRSSFDPRSVSDLKYTTNYLGSKQKFTDKIVKSTPDEVDTVLDGFGGSNVVGYEFKKTGRQVISNDTMRYSHHTAKAIIENNSVRLAENDIDMLLVEDKRHPHTVLDNYKGVYFTPKILNEIDSIRYNTDKLSGYKREIALSALGRTLISTKRHGTYGITNKTPLVKKQGDFIKTNIEFKERYERNINYLNSLVFDNKKKNKAYRKDVRKLAKLENVDMAYYDPPYVTQFSNPDYNGRYHFVEGVMANFKGGELEQRRDYKKWTEGDQAQLTKRNINAFFENFMSDKPKYTMVSYRDKSYPT